MDPAFPCSSKCLPHLAVFHSIQWLSHFLFGRRTPWLSLHLLIAETWCQWHAQCLKFPYIQSSSIPYLQWHSPNRPQTGWRMGLAYQLIVSSVAATLLLRNWHCYIERTHLDKEKGFLSTFGSYPMQLFTCSWPLHCSCLVALVFPQASFLRLSRIRVVCERNVMLWHAAPTSIDPIQ